MIRKFVSVPLAALGCLFFFSTHLHAAVVISTQPQPVTVLAGDVAVFLVNATGTGTLSYQWKQDGNPITGATNAGLVLNPVVAANAGSYTVDVSDTTSNTVTSSAATLSLRSPNPGDVDFSFRLGASINSSVSAVAVQSDGKVLIGGNFTTVNGVMRGGIARLNPDGSTDYTFGYGLAGAKGIVDTIALQSDGKVLIGGFLSAVNGTARNFVARLNSDGTLDTTFGNGLAGANNTVNAMALQSDGKVLIGGAFTSVNGTAINRIARLNSDGTLDTTFGNGLAEANSTVDAIALQSDGKVLIGGQFTTVNGTAINRIARLNTDGTLDTTFGNGLTGVDNTIDALVLQSDGKMLIGGSFSTVNGTTMNRIARLNSDGTLDTAFGNGLAGANNSISALALQSDGKMLIGGLFTSVNGATINRIARLNSDGTLDTAFGNGLAGVDNIVNALASQSDGKVLIGGNFTTVNGTTNNRIARLNSDGTLDTAFGNGLTGANGNVVAIALQSDGKVLIGGGFTAVNGTTRDRIARLNSDGTLDTTFGNGLTGASGTVNAIAPQSDGKMLIGGNFTTVNGTTMNRIARLNSDGTLDTTFGNGLAEANNNVNALALQSDGKVLIGGNFTTVNGTAINHIARLNSDGTLDAAFGNGLAEANNNVNALALQSDGKALIGGLFTSVNGTTINRIARLNSDGTLDTTFGNGLTGAGGTIFAVALQSDGKVLIGGNFTTVNGTTMNRIARLNTDGTLDTAFGNGLAGLDNTVSAMALQSDGKVLIGGSFASVNGTSHSRVARLWGSAATTNAILSALALSSGTLSPAFDPNTLSYTVTVPGNVTSLTLTPTTADINATVTVNGADAATPVTLEVGDNLITVLVTAQNGVTTSSYSVTVTREAPPTLSLPDSPVVAEATGPDGAVVSFTVTADDVEDGSLTPLVSPASGSTFPLGDTTVTASATDSADASVTNTFTVRVVDTTAPLITVPAAITTAATSMSGAVVTFSVSANDLVDGAVTATANPASGSLFPIGTNTVTVTAVDAHNNSATNTFLITITSAPEIGVALGTNDLTNPVSSVDFGTALLNTTVTNVLTITNSGTADLLLDQALLTGTDASQFSVDIPGTNSVAPGSSTTLNVLFTPTRSGTKSATLTIPNNDAANGTFTLTLHGSANTAPALSLPDSPVVAEATGPDGAAVSFTITADDVEDGSLTPLVSPASGSTFPLGDTTVTASATDSAGASVTNTFTVRVVDTTAPLITVPASITTPAASMSGAVVTFSVSANDLVDGAVTATANPASGSLFPIGTNTVTVTAVDAHNNSATNTFLITITSAPEIGVALGTNDLTNALSSVDFGTALLNTTMTNVLTLTNSGTADLLLGPAALTGTDASEFSVEAPGTNSVAPGSSTTLNVLFTPTRSGTKSATLTIPNNDAANGTFTLTLHGSANTAPALSLPDSPVVAEATGPDGAAVSFTITADDVEDGSLTPLVSPASGSTFPLGDTTVTASATDSQDVSVTNTFTVRVVDTTPPVISVPATITTAATSVSGAVVTFSVSANDLVDGAVTATANPASGSLFPIGTNTVTVTAVDAHNNSATNTFVITITSAPQIGVALGTNALTNALSSVDFGTALLNTTVTNVLTITNSGTADLLLDPAVLTGTDASQFSVGTPGTNSVAPGSSTTLNVLFTPTSSGVKSATLAIPNNDAANGTFTLTLHGSANTAPSLTLPDSPVVAEATGPNGAVVNFTVSADDVEDGSLTPLVSPASGSTFPLGDTTVTASATDSAGASVTNTFTVRVVDTTPPVISVPATITTAATSVSGAVVTFSVSANDLVDGAVTATANPASGSLFPIGTNTVTVTAVDAHNNSATNTFLVIVSEPPTLFITTRTNIVSVHWQNEPGWNLQETASLPTTATNWSYSQGVVLIDGTNYLTLTNAPDSRFYRLSFP